MIEGPGGSGAPRSPQRRFSPERIVGQLRTGFDALRRGTLPAQRHWDRSDLLLWRLRVAQRAFWLVLTAMGCYLVADLFLLPRQIPTRVSRASGSVAVPSGATEAVPGDQLKPLAEYRDALVTRNPFGLSGTAIQRTDEGDAEEKLVELTSTLIVVGVNRGRVLEALIEDTATQRTYFAKIGDVVNGVTVKAITAEGVVVGYKDAEMVLK